MSSIDFTVPRDQHLASEFLHWSKRNPREGQKQNTRYLFLLARYALHQGLRSLGTVPGDEVLVPAYICAAAVEAVQACGALPVFYRVRSDCCIDLEDIEKRISPRTRGLLIVHYFGFPQDLQAVRELADHRGIFLIEDCAHVLTGEFAGKPLGSVGDVSIFSWRKFLPTFDGAELVFNSCKATGQLELRHEPLLYDLKTLKYVIDTYLGGGKHKLAESVTHIPARLFQSIRGALRSGQHHQRNGAQIETNNSGFNPEFANSAISRISELIFDHSDVHAVVAKRKQNYKDLSERLALIARVRPLFTALPDGVCPLYFPMIIEGLSGAHHRLRQLGIPATAWDWVRPEAVHNDCFPDAAFLYDNLTFLPIHQNLRNRDLDLIAEAVNRVCMQSGSAAAAGTMSSDSESAREDSEATLASSQAAVPSLVSAGKPARKQVLFVAFHFPPHMGSSGHLRSLKYCRYLPEHGWVPTVLTVHPRAYEQTGDSQIKEVPPEVKVIRAFALDARKHLSLRGRYFRWTALPDRWLAWCLGAVPRGVFHIYRNKPDVLLTTFPIASAVLVGYMLHRITGIPWVADFRDSMTEEDYPQDPQARRALRWLEKKAVRHASRLIFTARSTLKMYLQRYPELSAAKCLVIPNGYDENDFCSLVHAHPAAGALRLHHSGLIYPMERDPVPFFTALSRLKKEKRISKSCLSVDLRASGFEEQYRTIVAQLGIEDLVHFLPALPYQQALRDSAQADALLLLQAACCDHQIPAKAYEYLRSGKPILALTSKTGDTAALLTECGGATIVDISDQEAIYRTLPEVLSAVRGGTHPLPRMQAVSRYSRQSQARDLAHCLSDVATIGAAGGAVPSVQQSERAQ